jgi:DNA adenine methylase
LAQFIIPLFPPNFENYYEPFLGSGAIFFAMRPQRAFLSDNNADLISTYIQVRDRPQAVIAELRTLKNSAKHYYMVRSWVPKSESQKAARMIYLSTLSFNGIHRVNLKGAFNVPYGYKTHLSPCEPERIQRTSQDLTPAHITCQDFEIALAKAQKGDAIYLDPPYTTAHTDNGFLKYNSKIFTWEDQKRLAMLANNLAARGCSVVVSNADHASIRNLYKNFDVLEIKRNSVIAASRDFRRTITECVYYSTPN